jgi:hypothetical protein
MAMSLWPNRFEINLDRHAGFGEQRGVRIAEIMEADVPHSRALHEVPECRTQQPRRDRRASALAKIKSSS